MLTIQIMQLSKQRIVASDSMGNQAVKKFVDACEHFKYKIEKSDEYTDIYSHIDYFITRPDGSQTSVDIKGGNKIDEIWVEFKNVQGYDGWVLGKAELIAFDMPEKKGFYIVKRKDLFSLSRSIVEKVFVQKNEAFRKLYRRKGRKDVITKINLDNLLTIDHKFIPYQKTN